MLKKILHFLAIGAAMLALLVVLLAVLLPLVIPIEKIKTLATQKASEILARPVTIEKASFNLFTGVTLKGIIIGERPGFSSDPFVTADSVELRANLLKLIFGQLAVESLRVVHPRLKVERNPDHLSNYQDILDRFKGKEEGTSKKITFSLGSFEVREGAFILIERTQGGKEEVKSFTNTFVSFKKLSTEVKGAPFSAKTLLAFNGRPAIPLGVEGRLSFSQAGEKLALYNLVVDINGEKLFGNIDLLGFSSRQRIVFDIASEKLDGRKLVSLLSTGEASSSATPRNQAKFIAIDFPKNIALEGVINLSKISWEDNIIDKLKGTLRLVDQKMAVNFSEFVIQGNTLNGQLQGDFTKAKEPRFYIKLGASRLDLNPWIDGKRAKEKGSKMVEGELTRLVNQFSDSIPANLLLDGEFLVTNCYFKKMYADQMMGSFNLRKKVLTGQVTVRGYKGGLSFNPSVDFQIPGIGYSLDKIVLNSLESQEFINDLVESFMVPPEKNREFKDRFTGTISGSVTLKGSGVEMKDILKNLQGNGSMRVANGTLKKLKALEGVGNLLNSNGLKGDIAFNQMLVEFSIGKETLTVSKLVADAEKAGFYADFIGKVDMVEQHYLPGNNLNVRLSAQNTTRIPANYNIFKDPATGWTTMDFELTGPISKPVPVPKLDEAPVVKQEKQRIQQEIQKQVDTRKQQLEKEAEQKLKELFKF